MGNFVCKSCGGSVTKSGNFYVCDFCHSKWALESVDDVEAIARANAWEALRKNDFERATELFEDIIAKDPANHEAYWGRALALNGIVYVSDYNEHKKVPTCNNITEESFLTNKDVQTAMSLAPENIKESYVKQAEQIEKIRIEWLEKASKEPAYDIFICFKDSDREHGIERTQDSIDVQDLYTALVAKGYNVFFSRVTLRDKVSEQYEPYIYNALKTAKIMIVFGESVQYFNAVWVKNEWSRFKRRIEKGEKHKNSLVTVYKNVDPYELPKALVGGRQALDYSIPSNFEVLIKHIKRVIDESSQAIHLEKIEIKGGQIAKKSAEIKTDTLQTREIGRGAITQTSIDKKQKLDLVKTYINGSDWIDALALLEDILFNDPNFAEAIWYTLLIKFHVKNDNELIRKIEKFDKADFDTVERAINCADKERAQQILDLLYDVGNIVGENVYVKILQKILPYNYEYRQERIKQAFDIAIKKGYFELFNLLLSTLEVSAVDEYINYNLQFALNTQNINHKEKCVLNVLEVNPGNLVALKALVKIQCEKSQENIAIKSLEELLKHSEDTDKEIQSLLEDFANKINNEAYSALVIQALKYYKGDLSNIKDTLFALAFRMIRQGYFGHAEIILTHLTQIGVKDAELYWGICLAKTKVTREKDIPNATISIKGLSEYIKYLTMVNEDRRQECISLAKQQELQLRIKKQEKLIQAEREKKLLKEKEERQRKNRKLKKILIPIFLIILLAVISIITPIEIDKKTRNYCILTPNSSGYTVTGVESNSVKKIDIPSSYKGKPITEIGNSAFHDCSSLENITIPGSVTSIGDDAFHGCSSLESIIIPGSVTSIGDDAFRGCSSLKSVIIGNGVTNIGDGAFSYCGNLTSITIPDSVTSMASSTFYNCDSLESITIGNGVTSIGDETFSYCTSLTSVTIGDSVTSIGSFAFYDCSSLMSITIPDSVTSIGSSAFSGCSILESITLPFVGESIKTASDTYQYPFGYIFGTNSYTGGSSTTQYYYGLSTSTPTSSTYYIPTSLKSVTITGGNILYSAFYNCSSLTNITIGNGVTSIGEFAFRGCSSLTNITIGNGVTSIGNSAFYDCSSLESLTIPDSVTSIGEYAFHACSNLESIIIPNSVTSIGSFAFYNCNSLESIIIPDSVTSIGSSALENCSSLTNITIGNGLTSIGEYAFRGCSSLESIIIPDSVTSIGSSAFSGCSSLESITLPFVGGSIKTATDTYQYPFGYIFGTSSYTGGTSTMQYYYGSSTSSTTSSTYYIPISLKSVTITGGNIVYSAFYDCRRLESITIGNGVTSIGDSAFAYCSNLTNIVIPDSVTSIGSSAFYNCSSLESITIGNGVTSIGNSAFSYCINLTNITIPDSVTSIGNSAFYNCSSLESIIIPNSVTSIGSYTFSYCTNLTSVTIGDSVTSIGNSAFSYCSSLESVIIPNRVTSIGSWAFSYCGSLESITIPNSVTSIGDYAFSYCSSLTSVTIGDSVTSIGSYTFSGCSSLESITLPFVGETKDGTENTHFGYIFGASSYSDNSSYVPTSLKTVIITSGTSIGTRAFYGCNSLEIVTILDSVTSIGDYAFHGCNSLEIVTIPDSVTSIGDYAFHGCNSLEIVTIPDSVTSIGNSAFYNCSSLESITIGNGVTSIGSYAFSYCINLTSITIPDSVTSIGNSAFYNCSSLESVIIPNRVTSIGSYAFYNCGSLERVYYKGVSLAQWNNISITSGNTDLTSATIYYYSESQPTSSGNYWHYVDGIAVAW